MGVDGCIACSTRQVLVLTVWDVEMGLGIPVFLRQTEIDHVDLVASLANAHQEVVWLDVAVYEGFGVDVFDAGNELIGEKQHGLERELAVAEVEEVFERGAEQIKDHGIVVTFCAEPSHEWNAHSSGKRLVDAGLVFKLWVFGLDAFELDRNLLARDDVGACT
jgi:hypothetical protein